MDEQQNQEERPEPQPVQPEPQPMKPAKDGSNRHPPKKPVTYNLGFEGFSEENLDKVLEHLEQLASKREPTAAAKMAALEKRKQRIGQLLAKNISRMEIIEQFKTCKFDLPGKWLSELIPQESKGKKKSLAKGIKDIAEHRKTNKAIRKK